MTSSYCISIHTVLSYFHVKTRSLYQHSQPGVGRGRKIILLLLHTSSLEDRYQRIWDENCVFLVHHQQVSPVTICHLIRFDFFYLLALMKINTCQKYHTKIE